MSAEPSALRLKPDDFQANKKFSGAVSHRVTLESMQKFGFLNRLLVRTIPSPLSYARFPS
jgi:hypothetical protein